MILRTICAGAMLLAAASLLSAPSAASASARQAGSLPRGGSYVLDPDPTVGAAAIALWFRAPGAGYDDASAGISRLAATAAAVAPLESGKSLYALVHTLGGELTIAVYPDIVGVGAVVPAPAARQVVAAMTAAYFAPRIDDAAVNTAKKDAAVLSVQQRYSSDEMLHDLLLEQMFSSGPAHYPPLPHSVTALAHVATADVDTFAKRAFRASNAVLMLTGNIDVSTIGAVTDGTGKAAMDAPHDSALAKAPEPTATAGAVDGLGLAWTGPPISDEKAATALDFVADYLFRDETGVVSKAIDQSKADTLLTGQFITLHDPGVLLVTIGGDDEKAAKQRVLDALAKLEQPMDKQSFDAALEAFLYHIAAETQTPQQQADNLGWYAAEGNPGYAPGDTSGAYERAARALDPQFVAGVVRRYLKDPVIVDLVTAAPAKESSP